MPGQVTIFKAETGEPVQLLAIDAEEAIRNHPNEWTRTAPATKPAGKKNETGLNAPSSDIITERAGPTRRDPPETPEAQRDITTGAPEPVGDGRDLGEVDTRPAEQPSVNVKVTAAADKPAKAEGLDGMSYAELQKHVSKNHPGEKTVGVSKKELLARAKTLRGGAASG